MYNILISTQHAPDVSNDVIRSTLIEKVINKVVPKEMLVDTKIVINPSGCFDVGGPAADAGLAAVRHGRCKGAHAVQSQR